MTGPLPPSAPPYVRYDEAVEMRQPDEDETVGDILASFDRLRRLTSDKHRHVVRDAHAKRPGACPPPLPLSPRR